ncbi:glycosyltransferase [Rheinheimera sp.]|uniref:glycosyltransferase n=1 Tax=Rheinheimera sp. TaxID=1869214 RepID=UPI00273463C4|nr:glycosyltransferase [Rheinheimera sp.]MDP2715865.1 glycosyltransferase [Rheinheimera sp.]
MNILTISTLYPNAQQPQHGIFVETRMRKLKQAYPQLQITVIAPCPRRYLTTKTTADTEAQIRHGIRVLHPSYLAVPGLGMYVNPYTLYYCLKQQLTRLLAQGERFDLIDAHYIYPDAVAAQWLAGKFKLPLVATARGSDIHLLPEYSVPRWQIKRTLAKVDAAIGVCQDLVNRMQRLQPALTHNIAIRNGVDLELFYPQDKRDTLRQELGYSGYALLSVGRLVQLKGQHKIIDIVAQLNDVTLTIIGDGEEKAALQRRVARLGISERVRFIAPQPQHKLREHYNAADCLVLASSREGWANVLLEAMACGCPVVTTPAGGTPEVIAHPHAGIVSKDFSVDALLNALLTLKQNMPAREDVSAYARTLSWDQSIILLKQTFDKVLQQRGNSAAAQGEQHVR